MTADEPMSTPDSGGLRESVIQRLTETIEHERRWSVMGREGDVRCLSCDLRYAERQEYGCHREGNAHSYDDEELAEARSEQSHDADSLMVDALAALLAAHPESVPTPDSADDATVGERERLGRIVRDVWIEWAREQPEPKTSWLVSWEGLSESDREVDRRIGERLAAEGPATPDADDADRAPVGGGLDEGEREHGTDHGHVVQVRPNGVLSTRLAESGEWFCGHCGMGVPEAADARGVRESSSQDADGSQVRPLASAPNSASSDAGDTSLDRLLSDFYHSDDGDYVAALGDLHKHFAARDAAWVERLATERDTARREAGERIAQTLRDAAVQMGGVGIHRDPCRLPDTSCLCGVCDFRKEASDLLRARADALTSDDGSGA